MKFLYTATLLLATCAQTFALDSKDSTRNYTIDDIVVKSYRLDMTLKNVPGKIEVISANQIARTPAFTIGEIIKKNTPCESVDIQGLNCGIDFRGFAPGSMGVNLYSSMLIDGMPMGTINAAMTLTSGIGSIEVLKGPFSALYGSGAMGGVVNIISLQSRGEISGSANVSFGSYNTSQAAVSVGGDINPSWDFDLSLEYLNQNNSYKTGKHNALRMTDYERNVMDDASYGKKYENSSYDKNGMILRVGHDFSDNWRINIYNNLYYTNEAASNGALWGNEGQTAKGVFRNYHRVDLIYTDRIHNVRLSPYFSRESSQSDYTYISEWGTDKSSEKKSYMTYGFQLQDVITLPFARLIVGIDNFSQRYKSTRKMEDGTEVYPWNPNYLDMQTSAFAQMNFVFFDSKLTSVVGVRYDNTLFRTFQTPKLELESSSKFYNSVNPTVALKYKVAKIFNIHGSFGRAFLVPHAYQTVGEYFTYMRYVGNRDLKPETAVTSDLGVGLNSRDGSVEIDATIFWTRHKNLIGAVYIDDYATFENKDKALMQGYEAMISVDFGRMFRKRYMLRVFGNYSRIFKSEVTKNQIKSEKMYVSRNNATFGAEYVDRRFSARFAGRYIGDKLNENWINFTLDSGEPFRKPLVGEKIITLPDFMIFDLSADFRISPMFSVGVKCANLLDENYMERDGYYMPGRNVMGQFSIRF